MTLSKIFDWYKVDFGDIFTFINKYSTIKVNKNTAIVYKEYDWSLNEKNKYIMLKLIISVCICLTFSACGQQNKK